MPFNKFTFDFDKFTFNGLRLGSELLFRPEEWPLCDKKNGYKIYLKDNTTTGLFLCFLEGYSDASVFNGSILINESSIKLSATTSVDDIKEIFSGPYDHWNDGVNESLSIEVREYDIEFLWTLKREEVLFTYIIIDYVAERAGV